jgi:undecaprenyl-phosphate galactose phosphotransferase
LHQTTLIFSQLPDECNIFPPREFSVGAYLIRNSLLPGLKTKYQEIPLQPLSVLFPQGYLILTWMLVFAYERLYTKRYQFWEETKVLIKSATVSSSLIILLIFFTKTEHSFSRTIVIAAWLFSLVLFPIARALVKLILVKLGFWNKKLFIIGVHQTSLKVLNNIRKNRTMGYQVIAFIDDDPNKIGKTFSGIQVIGPFAKLEEITQTYRSKDFMIVTPHLPRNKLKEMLAICERLSESMWLIPRSGDFITEGVDIDVIGDVLSLYIKRNLTKPWNLLIKETFDKALTLILLICNSPAILIIAIAIKLESRGPVIYTQKRIGKHKKVFSLYKFRSMYLDNEERLRDFFRSYPEAEKEWRKYKKLKRPDPRITKVGMVIRKLSLDELPQLINVLHGKMSLVGPRPYVPEELEGQSRTLDIISRVKPGLTGPWQVGGRSEVSFEKRLLMDEYYIRNWSLWTDIIILLKSIRVVASQKGAF